MDDNAVLDRGQSPGAGQLTVVDDADESTSI
jgi:hypothetical protein